MGAFDSIKMGYRCKAWSSQSEVPQAKTSVMSQGPKDQGDQWIVNAVTGGHHKEVNDASLVVLDGGPRWVLSTALGFLCGGIWWAVIFAGLFALGNYTLYANSADANTALTSADEVAGVVVYTILAAALSIASVPGEGLGDKTVDWKDLACGFVVEMVLCLFVVASAGIAHVFVEPWSANLAGLAILADVGRWATPALVWVAASNLRDKAKKEVQTKLAGLWCYHPIADSTSVPIESLWEDWSVHVTECAGRVGGYTMLGFKLADLAILEKYSKGEGAKTVIRKLGGSAFIDRGPTETWIVQSLTFLAGYDYRLRNMGPESARPTISLPTLQRVIRGLLAKNHPEVDAYQTTIDNDPIQEKKYRDYVDDENRRFYFAGALIADSDQREERVQLGQYGSRLAVSIALLVEGTDPLARLATYSNSNRDVSRFKLLSSAISSSTKALVSKLADSAGVHVNGDPLGTRGVAYATRQPQEAPGRLSYSPDEMVAASHLDEAIVISDATFAGTTPIEVFEKMWGGSERVEKRIDVSDMVHLPALEAGKNARRGFAYHVGFTAAILAAYLFGGASTGFVVLGLVAIPSSDESLNASMKDHFYMIYISYILNYIRFVSRKVSLEPRGRASVDKADKVSVVVFLFVNLLPTVSCILFTGWKWWVAFIPCMVANLSGLFNIVRYGWESAFEYEWWSWHVILRWYSGRRYLQIKDLRKRVGKNVLSVNDSDKSVPPVVRKVGPSCDPGVRFMVIG